MSNILLLSAELGMVAIGVAFLMIAGEFDLSVGSVLGLSAAIALPLMNYGYDPIMCVLISMFLCTCVGLLNGILVTQLRIHSLIITLGCETIIINNVKRQFSILKYLFYSTNFLKSIF